eukprot:CAMPEP_0197234186 /NCGR_PEP_ID=MMETSP1429-20130617/1990_1 /TAXON_ID=49237 /ORGANISM="Chaetoceros  sp., Strain UNC1202" /LENGTH=863 /DNA_ID=CAMNT_0042692531 /DNA_START=24 /DNA_END=2615 /DNA_ORIENTATION=-
MIVELLTLTLVLRASPSSAFQFQPNRPLTTFTPRYHNTSPSSPSLLHMTPPDGNDNDTDGPFFQRTPFFADAPDTTRIKTDTPSSIPNDEDSEAMARATATATATATAPPPLKEPSQVELALAEARALKERAQKERLEAEKMATILLNDKLSTLETQLSTKTVQDDAKKQAEIQIQMNVLKKQLDTMIHSNDQTKEEGEKEVTMNKSDEFIIHTPNSAILSTPVEAIQMPDELFTKRVNAYKSFSPEVQSLFANAAQVSDISPSSLSENAPTIIKKCYLIEKEKKRNGNISPMDLLDVANAQAGYETLPPGIQLMIAETAGLVKEDGHGSSEVLLNNTKLVEALMGQKKVKRTEDGGVEFVMDDPDKEDLVLTKEKGDRDFTAAEIDSATTLYENLPAPMKAMLAQSVGEKDESDSTSVVTKMIREKKLLPSDDGVEFVIFGNSEDGSSATMEEIQNAGHIKSLLPEVTRKEGQAPLEEDVDEFFKTLGKKTFNPTNKPERIPGGYIIRGDNRLKNGNELVKAIRKRLQEKESGLGEKLNFYFVRDPTIATEEDYQTDNFETPVLILTGTDLTPDTNRFVKPAVTSLGALSVVSFSVAVCLSTDLNMDAATMESMTGPLLFSIVGTQIAHEAAHQIVALKDKFKAGPPTIVPSLQLGLQGCITPIKSPPPSLNSLFDFAISGPLTGIVISLFLMYSGLEKQVFMDAAAQATLPSLPVDLVRSSGLAGGMVEWLLGDGTLVSTDPAALIKLHPYAIAGFIGIITNALNLLPLGNTDGGRAATALFGRSFAKFIRGVTLVALVGAGFFGGDEANLLLFFAIFAQLWQKEPVIPCQNEVDGVSDSRAVLAFMTAFLVGLAVVPLST